jgi:hypothetical protein
MINIPDKELWIVDDHCNRQRSQKYLVSGVSFLFRLYHLYNIYIKNGHICLLLYRVGVVSYVSLFRTVICRM